MSENKKTVGKYMDGFRKSDHEQILACLTDDIEWMVPSFLHIHGKEAFDKEIENEAFVGKPDITLYRIVEENNVVVAEGEVRSKRKDGGTLHAMFSDYFEMRDGKIRKITSYLMELKS